MSDYKGIYIQYPPRTWRDRHDPHVDDAEFRSKMEPIVYAMIETINVTAKKVGLKIVASKLAPDTWHDPNVNTIVDEITLGTPQPCVLGNDEDWPAGARMSFGNTQSECPEGYSKNLFGHCVPNIDIW